MQRVLVIDDEPGIIELIRMLLEDDGHEVYGATSVREAREAMKKHLMDVVFLDLMMPEATGWDLLDSLPENEDKRPNIAIISAIVADRSVERARDQYGIKKYVKKPFQISEIIDFVNTGN